jgi:hypothetical protein
MNHLVLLTTFITDDDVFHIYLLFEEVFEFDQSLLNSLTTSSLQYVFCPVIQHMDPHDVVDCVIEEPSMSSSTDTEVIDSV